MFVLLLHIILFRLFLFCRFFFFLCVCLLMFVCVSWVAAILPLALVHTLGNLFTNMSLGQVAVSFTHTIKAMEPFFSVLLSAMFLGEVRT